MENEGYASKAIYFIMLEKSEHLTVTRLIELIFKKSNKDADFPNLKLPSIINKNDMLRVVVHLIIYDCLALEFRTTAFSTNAYVTIGKNERSFRSVDSIPKIVLFLKKVIFSFFKILNFRLAKRRMLLKLLLKRNLKTILKKIINYRLKLKILKKIQKIRRKI